MSAQSKRREERSSGSEDQPTRMTAQERGAFEIANQKKIARVGGKSVELTLHEALLMKVIETSMAGSPYSQRLALSEMRRVDEKRQAELRGEIDTAEAYIEHMMPEVLRRRAEGLPEDDILPHPEDIRTDLEKGVSFAGPMDADDLKKYKENCDFCDVLLLQDVMEQRCSDKPDDAPPVASSAMLIFFLVQRNLPKRMQLSDFDILKAQMRHNCMTKRELLKTTFEAWRSIGTPLKRGALLPSRESFEKIFNFMIELRKRLHAAQPNDAKTREMITQQLIHSTVG